MTLTLMTDTCNSVSVIDKKLELGSGYPPENIFIRYQMIV